MNGSAYIRGVRVHKSFVFGRCEHVRARNINRVCVCVSVDVDAMWRLGGAAVQQPEH